jgi:hypothetical protein
VNTRVYETALKKLKTKALKFFQYIEEVIWRAKLEHLMNLCGDSGGESSPWFNQLQKHIDADPRKNKTQEINDSYK